MADKNTFQLKTALGAGVLQLNRFEGREEMSRLYAYQVVAVSKKGADIDFDKLLGAPAEVTISVEKGASRVFHGIVAEAAFEGYIGELPAYRLEVVPWLWLATRAADVRIFQNLTTKEILEKILTNKYGGATEFKLTRPGYLKRAYCVQYRETDFDFVSRLMEEEGIGYFFKHEAGKHTMVIFDKSSVHVPLFGLSALPYREDWSDLSPVPAVTHWRWRHQIQTGKVTLRDHHFLKPKDQHEKTAAFKRKHASAELELYDYPARLPEVSADADIGKWGAEAQNVAKSLLDERQVRFAVAEGRTRSVHVAAGALLKLEKHPLAAQNGDYVVFATQVRLEAPDAEAMAAGSGARYEAVFEAFKSSEAYCPQRRTPKPRVGGPQTATVVGPAGEEVFTDPHGRVKVQFHWDREGQKNEKSSCFVRVAQPGAGKGFGFLALPRIGHEVVVDFVDGDPDRPLIVGSVYNAENVPPYALPDQKTVLAFKSRSFGGGVANYNELRFDDKQGNEYLMLRAQKDRYDVVQHDMRTDIGNNEEHTVGKNSSTTIGESADLTIGKNAALTVGESAMVTIGKDLQVSSGGTYGTTVSQGYTVDAGTDFSMNAGTNVHLKAGTGLGVEAGTNVHIKGGINVVIEAGIQLTIKAGPASVVLGPDGVSITGPMVKINSGGGPGSGAGAKPVKPTKPQKAKKPEKLKDPLQGKHR